MIILISDATWLVIVDNLVGGAVVIVLILALVWWLSKG